MFVHFRRRLRGAQRGASANWRACSLSDYLEPAHSYLSMIELGLYESTSKVYGELGREGRASRIRRSGRPEIEAALERSAQGHGAAAVARNPAGQISLLLSDGPEARRIRQLVHGADGRPRSA